MTEETLVITTKEGCDYIIVEYIDSKKVKIKFLDEHCFCKIVPTTSLKTGSIKNPYFKKKYNIGYIGDGVYKSTEKGISTRIYNCWVFMIERCYNKKRNVKNKNYNNVIVCEEWHNFQNYAKWYEENYIEGFELDKDLLQQGIENKIYSPETCVFLPHNINVFLTNNKCNNKTGMCGVSFYKRYNKWQSNIKVFNEEKILHLGYFSTPEEANLAYIEARKQQAENVKQYMRNIGYWNENIIELIK